MGRLQIQKNAVLKQEASDIDHTALGGLVESGRAHVRVEDAEICTCRKEHFNHLCMAQSSREHERRVA